VGAWRVKGGSSSGTGDDLNGGDAVEASAQPQEPQLTPRGVSASGHGKKQVVVDGW
jgi:hypothetical protein